MAKLKQDKYWFNRRIIKNHIILNRNRYKNYLNQRKTQIRYTHKYRQAIYNRLINKEAAKQQPIKHINEEKKTRKIVN